MAYPSTPIRSANYYNDEQNHLTSPDPAKLDAEQNTMYAWASAANALLRAITTAAGALRNVAAATAQSMAGSQTFTATASQTAFLTTIDWVAAFTSANVAVFRNGTRLPNSSITVASGTGAKLQVTIPASTNGDVIQIDAYESGAGLLVSLAGTTGGTGAELIGVYDPDGKFTSTTVNGVLREIILELDNLTTALGAPGNLIRADGTVPMAAALAMGAHKITGLLTGSAATDAVTYAQLEAVAGLVGEVTTLYLKLTGEDPMSGNLDMGSHKIINVTDPVDAQDAETKAHAATTFVPKAGGIFMTGTLGGSQGVAGTDFTTKAQVEALTSAAAPLSRVKHFFNAGTDSWTVPDGSGAEPAVTVIIAHCIGGGCGGGTSPGGPGGGYARARLVVTPGESLNVIVGAGGALALAGGDTELRRLSTTLCKASGGAPATPGTGVTGDLFLTGGGRFRPHFGDGGSLGGKGGSGAGPYGGEGGSGSETSGDWSDVAKPGTSPGGGGGGGSTNAAGAVGAPGAVIIEY